MVRDMVKNKKLTEKEFFEQIADNLEHLKNKSDRIGFCFSYPMTIKENGDGILLGFSNFTSFLDGCTLTSTQSVGACKEST